MLSIVLKLMTLVLATNGVPQSPTAQPAYAVASIRAHAFYQETGKFGSTDLFDPSLALWNAIIGGGDLEAPTAATLILVEVKAPVSERESEAVLSVVARAGDSKLLDQELALRAFFTEKPSRTFPFLVYDTGCEEVTISVRILLQGQQVADAVQRIPFQCGE